MNNTTGNIIGEWKLETFYEMTNNSNRLGKFDEYQKKHAQYGRLIYSRNHVIASLMVGNKKTWYKGRYKIHDSKTILHVVSHSNLKKWVGKTLIRKWNMPSYDSLVIQCEEAITKNFSQLLMLKWKRY
ncbi:MAG: hypothetical protein ACO2ZM_07450 [Francisellaceae bacterium]